VTRIIHLGGETGHIHAEGVTTGGTGTQTFDTGTKRTGTRAYKFDGGAGGNFIRALYAFTGATSRTYWATCWFHLPAGTGLPATANRLLGFLNTGATLNICSIELTAGGKIQLRIGHDGSGNSAQHGSDSSATVTHSTWYRLDLAVETAAGANDYAECWLDGTSVASGTGLSFSDSAPGILYWGWGAGASGAAGPGANEVVFVDDILLQDEQGSANNTLPAEDEGVVLLLPESDFANVSDRWLEGAGGTTNLWEAVNNIPPAGVSTGSSTATSQIENAINNTTNEYDALMQSYATAGLGSSDVVTAVYSLVEGANSSTTGSDTLDFLMHGGNPSESTNRQSIDIVASTYPSGWNRLVGPPQENPSVVIATSPKVGVAKVVGTTRVATVCLMSMYVSYYVGTPPAASAQGPRIASGAL
jgi:hypothetical protein